MKKAASIFSLFCGVSMLVAWGILLVTGKVVELRTEPFETIFLLGAEFLTAISVLIGGFGLLISKRWGLRADLAALGMLLLFFAYMSIFHLRQPWENLSFCPLGLCGFFEQLRRSFFPGLERMVPGGE